MVALTAAYTAAKAHQPFIAQEFLALGRAGHPPSDRRAQVPGLRPYT
ncbi:hypothetical protein QFZ68_000114 [Streptomyces sp. V1I6]|nr:hypothetical protein [Streptomyces sp. V1I6]